MLLSNFFKSIATKVASASTATAVIGAQTLLEVNIDRKFKADQTNMLSKKNFFSDQNQQENNSNLRKSFSSGNVLTRKLSR